MGAIEYRKLKRGFYCEEIGEEKGDEKIIERYKEFCYDRRADDLIFSMDNNFIYRVI